MGILDGLRKRDESKARAAARTHSEAVHREAAGKDEPSEKELGALESALLLLGKTEHDFAADVKMLKRLAAMDPELAVLPTPEDRMEQKRKNATAVEECDTGQKAIQERRLILEKEMRQLDGKLRLRVALEEERAAILQRTAHLFAKD
jgi:hypothetical protein